MVSKHFRRAAKASGLRDLDLADVLEVHPGRRVTFVSAQTQDGPQAVSQIVAADIISRQNANHTPLSSEPQKARLLHAIVSSGARWLPFGLSFCSASCRFCLASKTALSVLIA